jgi:hypothetical protein
VEASNIEQTKPEKKPSEKASSFKVSVTCKNDSGVTLKEGDLGYADCLSKKTSPSSNTQNKNPNEKSLNFSFGN